MSTDVVPTAPVALRERLRSVGARVGLFAPGMPVHRYGLLLLSIVIAVAVEAKYGSFLTVSNTLTTLNNVAALAIGAIGAAALVIAGRIDLSIGGELALLAVVTALVGQHVGPGTDGTIACVAVALIGGAGLGLLNAVLVRALHISPLIVTLATGGVYTGVALAATSGIPVPGIPNAIVALGTDRVIGIPIPVIVAAGLFLLGGWVLIATVTGLRIYAIGGNQAGATLTGVPVERIVAWLFCLQGILIGVVALILVGQIGSGSSALGLRFEFQVLTAVLLGGILFTGGGGRPLALLFGVITIGVVNAALVFIGVQDWWSQIINGIILLMALGADQFALKKRERKLLRSPAVAASVEGDVRLRGEDSIAGDVSFARRSTDGGEPDLPPVLEAHGVELRYGAVQALLDVDFSVAPGEIVCLLGDNGAGKSSLIKVLSGVVAPTRGTLRMDGKEVHFSGPQDARRAGTETVYQDLAVCPNLNVAHNIVLGAEPRRGRLLRVRDDTRALCEARRRLDLIGATIGDYRRPVQWLSGGQRQTIAIARVLHDDVRVAIFDEPTAALGVGPTARVLDVIRRVARNGVGVVLVTHDIEAVIEIADRIVVLRLGQVSHSGPAANLTEGELAQFMAGLPSDRVLGRRQAPSEAEIQDDRGLGAQRGAPAGP